MGKLKYNVIIEVLFILRYNCYFLCKQSSDSANKLVLNHVVDKLSACLHCFYPDSLLESRTSDRAVIPSILHPSPNLNNFDLPHIRKIPQFVRP